MKLNLVPRRISASSIAVLATLLPVPAMAAAICGVFTSAMNFGNYDVLSAAPTDSSTNVVIICLRNPPPNSEVVSYTLQLSTGSGSYSARTLLNGANSINYNLYTSPSMSPATIWGDGAGGTAVVSGSLGPLAAGSPIAIANHTIYGRIPAGQDVPVGTYTSTVVLTMNY